MPLTKKGREIETALEKEYGKEKGEQVLYAGKNKGTFTGIDEAPAGGEISSFAVPTPTMPSAGADSALPVSARSIENLPLKVTPDEILLQNRAFWPQNDDEGP